MTPEVFTADYVGRPGQRAFYLQARTADAASSYLLEKDQVVVLADKLRELLLMIDREDTVINAEPARDPALALSEPVEPEWRVGTIGLTYDEDDDRVVIFMKPAGPEEETPDEIVSFDTRLMLRRDQVRAFVLHAVAVAAEGRPLCQLCGLPMDPDGHNCPASNGHRPTG
ncbi:MAG: DUF3090 family protein [Actinomycetota bacterium]